MTRRKAAIIGAGVIGGGWAARFLLNGWDVAVFDPDPEAPRKIAAVLDNARRSLPALADVPLPPEGRLRFAATMGEAVAGADHVQESVSERLELKHRVYAQIQQAAPGVLIASSTSGFKASDLQAGAAVPGRIIVVHPFNPVYLLPLAEIAGSPVTPLETIEETAATIRAIGMYPLILRTEIDAFLGNRFLEAVWREALWMVRDGVATTAEIDEAIRMGFGLRWGQMGLFETYRIAGGEGGMRHFLAQFGPTLTWPWTRLMDVPDLDDALMDAIAAQSDAQSGAHSIRDLERIRDGNLVGFLRVLKARDWGAGQVLNAWDAARRPPVPALPDPLDAPLVTAAMTVLPDWLDYNGHMTEARYLHACSMTTDAFLDMLDARLNHVAQGFSYYSAETHIRHLGEGRQGDRIAGSVQVLQADDKRLHVWVRIARGDDVIATIEQMLLHVDMKAGRACPAPRRVLDRLEPIAAAHAALPRPAGAGRHVGQRRE
ncbi:MAG: carnitine 3-dehydrogenase [Gemmobacter sp.]